MRAADEVRTLAHILDELQDGEAEIIRDRDDSSRQPRDLADQLRDGELLPVLEERKQHQRSPGERER